MNATCFDRIGARRSKSTERQSFEENSFNVRHTTLRRHESPYLGLVVLLKRRLIALENKK